MPYFETEDGSVHYRVAGEGPLLVLLPGNTASSACHAGEIEHFSDRFTVAAIDFRGTGRSARVDPWPADWWTRAAADVARLVSETGHERAVLAGTSGGATIALLAAIEHPERVRAVIADSTIAVFHPDELRAELDARGDPSAELVSFWTLAHGEDWADVVRADTELLRGLADAGGDVIGEGLGRIRCPVLLTASLSDETLPDLRRQIVEMADSISDSRVFLVKEGGHPMMWTAPADFRSECDRFVRMLDPV